MNLPFWGTPMESPISRSINPSDFGLVCCSNVGVSENGGSQCSLSIGKIMINYMWFWGNIFSDILWHRFSFSRLAPSESNLSMCQADNTKTLWTATNKLIWDWHVDSWILNRKWLYQDPKALLCSSNAFCPAPVLHEFDFIPLFIPKLSW